MRSARCNLFNVLPSLQDFRRTFETLTGTSLRLSAGGDGELRSKLEGMPDVCQLHMTDNGLLVRPVISEVWLLKTYYHPQ